MNGDQKEEAERDSQLETLAHDLEEERKRSEDYLTQLRYLQADLDNLNKRLNRQVEETKKYCNERLIVELLGIVDELEMAIKTGHSPNSKENVIQGVEMTLKKLKKVLEKEGVSTIECVGKRFDSSKHDAVSKIERDNVDECTVVEEIRKGYTMKEKVIRPSIVMVAVKRSSESQKEVEKDE